MCRFLSTFGVVLVASHAAVQGQAWKPAPGHTQIPLWPGTPPDSRHMDGPERVGRAKDSLVAGRPWLFIENVSQPTMTVYPAKGKNTGATVVVFPGGGYQVLAIDLEGTEICDWFTSRGINCVLLKYRVPYSGPGWDPKLKRLGNPKPPMALEDAQRAMGLLRLHAKEWHIDPHKIGVIGFSAGGHLVASISTHFDKRIYRPLDAADKLSCRPDFAIALYPGHLWVNERKFELNPDVTVTGQTPPTFIVQAENDPVDSVNNSLVYYLALKKAEVPVEMHLYPQGAHAFGLRKSKFPITTWPNLVLTWLQSIDMLEE